MHARCAPVVVLTLIAMLCPGRAASGAETAAAFWARCVARYAALERAEITAVIRSADFQGGISSVARVRREAPERWEIESRVIGLDGTCGDRGILCATPGRFTVASVWDDERKVMVFDTMEDAEDEFGFHAPDLSLEVISALLAGRDYFEFLGRPEFHEGPDDGMDPGLIAAVRVNMVALVGPRNAETTISVWVHRETLQILQVRNTGGAIGDIPPGTWTAEIIERELAGPPVGEVDLQRWVRRDCVWDGWPIDPTRQRR